MFLALLFVGYEPPGSHLGVLSSLDIPNELFQVV